jgi:hypothetical protein
MQHRIKSLTTGEVAQKTGVGLETIRLYEREGLIQDPPRSVILMELEVLERGSGTRKDFPRLPAAPMAGQDGF